jgi:hypothetical protein
VIVVDRDSKRPEIFRLAGSQYVAVQADADRCLRSDVVNVRFQWTDSGRLVIEDVEDATARSTRVVPSSPSSRA